MDVASVSRREFSDDDEVVHLGIVSANRLMSLQVWGNNKRNQVLMGVWSDVKNESLLTWTSVCTYSIQQCHHMDSVTHVTVCYRSQM